MTLEVVFDLAEHLLPHLQSRDDIYPREEQGGLSIASSS